VAEALSKEISNLEASSAWCPRDMKIIKYIQRRQAPGASIAKE
jgi:hypothetical protein